MEVERRSLSFFFSLRISHPRSGNYCVCDGLCTHTPCRTHIFLTPFPCVAYRHRVHAWLKVFAVRMPHLPISPSPLSCFIHRRCSPRTVTSTLRSCLHLPCRTVPDPKARVKRTSARAEGSLASWPIARTPQEFRSQVERHRRQRGEAEQDGPSDPVRRESGLEEDCGMEVEDEVERRKKLDEQRKRLQRQLRDVERFGDVSQEVQSSLKKNLQKQPQEVEQRRNDLLPEHQRAQKRSQKIQNIQDKKRNLQRETAAAREEMRKIREDIFQKEEHIFLCQTKAPKMK